MAILSIPETGERFDRESDISRYLLQRGIFFDRWKAPVELPLAADQATILAAYASVLEPFMAENGYTVADVVNIHPGLENYPAIRAKFLAEHTHSEDEVRFFVDGEGLFWFNIDGEPVFNVLCQRGDLISVPKNTKHWFDAGETHPKVKAIRIFIDPTGWVPHYTQSGIEQEYA